MLWCSVAAISFSFQLQYLMTTQGQPHAPYDGRWLVAPSIFEAL
jgi:hypothetical protein